MIDRAGLFPATSEVTYLNTASVALGSAPGAAALARAGAVRVSFHLDDIDRLAAALL